MSYEQTPPQPTMPAGWYPDDTGLQRYWDGVAWTEHTAAPANQAPAYQAPAYQAQYGQAMVGAPTSDETSMASLAHALAIFVAFIGPLVILLTKGDQSVYVKHHAIEALNFSITVTIAMFVSLLLMIVLIGFLLVPVVAIGALVLHIMAAIAASRGEWYRYPLTLRLISGPV